MAETFPPPNWYADPTVAGRLRFWDGVRWTEHIAPAPLPAPPPAQPSAPPSATSVTPTTAPTATASPIQLVTHSASVTPGVIRGTSFGSTWVEVEAGRGERKALSKLIKARGKSGPKSMRFDDAVLTLSGSQVNVTIGGSTVGWLNAGDSARYARPLSAIGRPVESSGIVLIDAEGHPGEHIKLYLPDEAALLVPLNEPDPSVRTFFAHDRAGSITLAHRKAEHQLAEAATAYWWTGSPFAVWVVLTRSEDDMTATLSGQPLPDLDPERSAALRAVWDQRMAGERRLQLEARVYEVKSGRQIAVRHQL